MLDHGTQITEKLTQQASNEFFTHARLTQVDVRGFCIPCRAALAAPAASAAVVIIDNPFTGIVDAEHVERGMKNSDNQKVTAADQSAKEFVETEFARLIESHIREHHSGEPWPDRMCKTNEVTEVTGLSRAQIFRLVNAGKFPGPIHLSEARIAWPASVIRQWLADRIAKHAASAQAED